MTPRGPRPERPVGVTRHNRGCSSTGRFSTRRPDSAAGDQAGSLAVLFNQDLLAGDGAVRRVRRPQRQLLRSAPTILRKPDPSWAEIAQACEFLRDFIADGQSSLREPSIRHYVQSSTSGSWADDDLKKVLEMFNYPNGSRLVGRVAGQHTERTTTDYADDIYDHLVAGRLVIVDQSSGDPVTQQGLRRPHHAAHLRGQPADFRNAKDPADILVYVEEAHNILPAVDRAWT